MYDGLGNDESANTDGTPAYVTEEVASTAADTTNKAAAAALAASAATHPGAPDVGSSGDGSSIADKDEVSVGERAAGVITTIMLCGAGCIAAVALLAGREYNSYNSIADGGPKHQAKVGCS